MGSGRLGRRGIGSDTVLSAILQIVIAAANFVLTWLVLRGLTPDEAGHYFLVLTYLILASSLADFGVAATIGPRIAVAGGLETPGFKAAVIVRTVAVLVAWGILNLYLLLAGKTELLLYVNIGYLAVLFSARLVGMRQFPEMLWRIKGRTYVVTAVAAFDAILTAVIIGIFVWLDRLTVGVVMIALGLGSLPGCIAVMAPILREIRGSVMFRQSLRRSYYRRFVFESMPVAVMVIAGQAVSTLETPIIDAFLSKADISAYNAAVRPLVGLMFLATTISFGLSPVVSQIHRGARTDVSMASVVSVGIRIIGVITIGICVIGNIFAEPIMRIFGAEYVHAAYILRIYSVTVGLIFLAVLFDQFLLAIGARRQVLYGALLSFLLALTLEVALVQWWRIEGMMYAKIIALLALVTYQLSALGHEMRGAALRALRQLAIPGVVMAAALALTGPLALPLRALVVLVLVLGTIAATRTVQLAELRWLRALQLS